MDAFNPKDIIPTSAEVLLWQPESCFPSGASKPMVFAAPDFTTQLCGCFGQPPFHNPRPLRSLICRQTDGHADTHNDSGL